MLYQSYRSIIRRKAASILLICVLLLTPFLGVVFAAQTGQIDVTVQGYDGVSTMTASLLDSNGGYLENKTVNSASFFFTGVSLDKLHSIILTYNGVPYTTQVNATKDSQKQVNIRVYELATSDEGIKIAFQHVALFKGEDSIVVSEYIQFLNIGDKVQNGTDLKIYMPQGYKNYKSSHSCCMTKTDFGFLFKIPSPVLPGEMQVFDLDYEISSDTDQYKFAKISFYDTDDVIVTIPTGTDFKAVPNSYEALASQGIVDIDEKTYDSYSGQSIFAGEGYALAVTGYKSTSINVVWVGTGVLFAVIIGAAVYGFRGTRISAEKLGRESEALTSVIAELEKDFSEGTVKELDYLRLKVKYKGRLEKVQARIQEVAKAQVKAKEKKEPEKNEES